MNDAILLLGLKKGKQEAYTQMVETFHSGLCAHAYGLTGDYDLAEDIVQNVYIKIWRKRKNLKDNINLKSYLYKSVYNSFIDQYRKMRHTLPIEKTHLKALRALVHEESENSLERLITLVRKEIENLPPKCREVFLMSKTEGLTNNEIAEYLNITTKSVEGHITKAFTLLRKHLDDKSSTVLFLLFGLRLKEGGMDDGY